MATCSTTVCGTGGWTGPIPGDPDLGSVTLSAAASFGGITVRWSYPLINAFAVAHTQVFRGSTSSFSSAMEIAVAAGNNYFDAQDNTTVWYYWIRVVSVNGTVGELIGPASAQARKLSDDIIDNIYDEIDKGKLAIALRQEIDLIPFLNSKLLAEIFDRETGQVSLAQAIQDANNGVAQAMTFIGTVNSSLITANSALAETLQVTAAVLQNGIAAVTEETEAKVAVLDGKITAEATSREQVVAQLDQKYGVITDQANVVISQVNGRVSTEILDRQQAITNVGNRITGVEVEIGVNANEITNIYESMWTVRLQAGNLIGGFGLYNDGIVVQAGFDVDRFWIGRGGGNPATAYPFVVEGNDVYIKKAIIKDATIDTLKVAGGSITSMLYSPAANLTIYPGQGAVQVAGTNFAMAAGSSGVIIMFIASVMSGNYADFELWIAANDVDLIYRRIYMTGDATIFINVPAFHANPSTNNTYVARVSHSGGPAIMLTTPTLTLMGGKR